MFRSRVSVVGVVSRLRAGRTIRGSIPRNIKTFFCSPKCPDRLWGPPSFLFIGCRGLLFRVEATRRRVDHLHLVPRSRMSGSIPLLPLYAFKAWTGTNLALMDLVCFCVRVLFYMLKSLYECKHVTEKQHFWSCSPVRIIFLTGLIKRL
jgi:hypothetical protein